MVAWPALEVERTGISSRAIRVKRISIRRPLIVSIAWKLPACTHTNNMSTGLDAFAARRTIGVKRACHGLHAGKRQCQSCKPIFRADFLREHHYQLARLRSSGAGRLYPSPTSLELLRGTNKNYSRSRCVQPRGSVSSF